VARRALEPLRRGLPPLAPELLRLRGTATFGHRLGEVREYHREPEPERDGEDEAGRSLSLPDQRLYEEGGRQHAADLDDEHDGVLYLVPRIELPERTDDRAAHDRQLEERARFPVTSRHPHPPQAWSSRCSTTGPRARAGRNVRAPTMITTPISNVTKSGVCVGSVPGPAGTSFFWASDPAIARVGIASQ